MMGSEEATTTIPKLSLFSMSPISAKKSPAEPSGMLTPPIQTSGAAVPFGWEEEPGKPRPCTALTTTTTTNKTTLELPPRLFSPTTVLEGPYMKKRPKASSFRMTIKESSSPTACNYKYNNALPGLEDELGATIFLSKRWQRQRQSKEKSWFLGAWSRRRKLEEMLKRSDPGELSFVFPSDSLYRDCDEDEDEYDDVSNITRTGSFAIHSSHSHSHSHSQHKSQFWATIYGGLKQVMPWKSKKFKKSGL